VKEISGTIQLKVRGELVQIDLTIPADPVRPSAMIPAFQSMTNALVGQAIGRTDAEGKPVSCNAGCWACCRHLIPLTEGEAHYLAGVVNAMPAQRRAEVRRRFADTLELLREKGLLTALRDPAQPGAPSPHDLGMAYFALGIPCPFLENSRCSIHSQRPLVCREHLVTSAPSNCEDPSADSICKVPIPASVFGTLVTIDRKRGPSHAPYVPLALALAWAEANPETSTAFPGQDFLKQVVENLAGKPLDNLPQ